MTKLTIFFTAIMFLFVSSLNNRLLAGVQVLIKGKIVDELNHKPIGVNIEFRDKNGKKNQKSV